MLSQDLLALHLILLLRAALLLTNHLPLFSPARFGRERTDRAMDVYVILFSPLAHSMTQTGGHFQRRAKTRCAITQVGTPCVECQYVSLRSNPIHFSVWFRRHTRKKCTFDELPRERKKPTKRASSPQDMDIDTLPQAAPTAPTSPNPAKRARTTEDGASSNTISLEDILGYHALTAVLTDDLLPIGARTSGRTSS